MNKRMCLTLIAIGLLMVVAQSGYAESVIDVNKSRMEWVGTKVTGQHNGTLDLISGEVDISDTQIKSARFVLDMRSLQVLDIQDKGRNKKLVSHLKNDDFFSVDKYPTAIFELSQAFPIKGVSPKEENYEISGDLTIKGITHAITFKARIDLVNGKAQARGTIIVDRTKYGITYKSGSIFESIGDRAIHDEFSVRFDVITE